MCIHALVSCLWVKWFHQNRFATQVCLILCPQKRGLELQPPCGGLRPRPALCRVRAGREPYLGRNPPALIGEFTAKFPLITPYHTLSFPGQISLYRVQCWMVL